MLRRGPASRRIRHGAKRRPKVKRTSSRERLVRRGRRVEQIRVTLSRTRFGSCVFRRDTFRESGVNKSRVNEGRNRNRNRKRNRNTTRSWQLINVTAEVVHRLPGKRRTKITRVFSIGTRSSRIENRDRGSIVLRERNFRGSEELGEERLKAGGFAGVRRDLALSRTFRFKESRVALLLFAFPPL